MSTGFWRRVGAFFGRSDATGSHRYSDAELLARTEEFNQNADSYWKAVGSQESGRRHVLNRPFAGPTAAVDLYRFGLMMTELRLGPGLDVLDFGAGTCWLSSCLNRIGCRAVAVDVSQAALDLGRELFSLDRRHREDLAPQFRVYDGHRLPLEDESVDRIACYDAFHHVPNQDELLREMHRVLRSGGRVVMAEPGEGHSHADTSIFDESVFSVLENDFDILDVDRRARTAGFSEVRVKPYLDPSVEAISASAYTGLGGQRWGLELSTLRAGVGVAAALRNSFRTCAIVVLTKGAQVRDSRSPGSLRAKINLLAPSDPLRGYVGTALQARARLKNVGDTLWRHSPDAAGGTVLLGSHLLDSSGRPLQMDYVRAALPYDVQPGAEVEVVLAVPLPGEPGAYTLRFDPVDDGVMWFSQAGSTPLDVALNVVETKENGAYRSVITLLADTGMVRLPAGSRTRIPLRIQNVGAAAWPRAETSGPGAIRLGAQLLDDAGSVLEQDYARADLPGPVEPGGTCELRLELKVPSTPGRYAVSVDTLQEQVCWFAQRGSQPLVIACEATADVADSAAPGVLRAHLDLLQPDSQPVRAAAGQAIEIRVRARNLGNTLWRHGEDATHGHVRLAAMLVFAGDRHDYWRAPLPHDASPGETVEIQGTLPVPMTLGEYTVVLDLVDEGIAWFQHEGSPVASFSMSVEPPRTAAAP